MSKMNILSSLGLPTEFGIVLLLLALILLLAPYFSDHDFGIFKIPLFKNSLQRRLKIVGPVIMLIVLGLHVPFMQVKNGAKEKTNALKEESTISEKDRPSATAPVSSEAATAIFMESQIAPLPISIPPGEVAHIVSLNKRKIASPNAVNWGFYTVANHEDTTRKWPDKKIMDHAREAHNFAIFAWKAEVSNHGPTTVIDLVMKIKLWFGNEKPEKLYNVIVTPLDAGKTFVFYLVNDCPTTVSAVWPEKVALQVLGEQKKREVQLHRTYQSPIDQIMIFMGSTTRLVGDHPCGEP
jgi:hypothetical protein